MDIQNQRDRMKKIISKQHDFINITDQSIKVGGDNTAKSRSPKKSIMDHEKQKEERDKLHKKLDRIRKMYLYQPDPVGIPVKPQRRNSRTDTKRTSKSTVTSGTEIPIKTVIIQEFTQT